MNGEGKMIGSAGRRGLWRLKDAHNRDNRAWKREKWVMVRGNLPEVGQAPAMTNRGLWSGYGHTAMVRDRRQNLFH